MKAGLQRLPPAQHAALFMHHHPVDIGSAWIDEMGLKNRDRLWTLLEENPQVKAIFHGHIHQEFTGHHECGGGHKIAVFGTPSTCVQGKPTDEVEFDHTHPAWREIMLDPDGKITTRVCYLPIGLKLDKSGRAGLPRAVP